ncbi:MAG: DNA polymerase sliding clamp [Methanomassiliicoccales archaeon Mx-03]|nr:DNA polymerase sliding clamp [Methanomassiliicoccaceae archaeon DOK]TQS78724.1 MAG: DNA polymerase sliding clamp [Methanomassiliicoccales archaeon Mx-03]
MFSADLKSDTLKGLVNIISTLIDEVKFTITPEGMTLKAVDAAHVAMIEMEVEKCAFDKYEAEDCEIGLDLDKVKDVLKLAASGDVIGMEQDDTHGRLVFKVGNITRRMNLVDTTTMSDPKVPQLSLTAKISLPVDELQKGIRAADKISDHITLKAGPGYFDMFCEGDTDSVSLHLDGASVEVDSDSEVCSMFPLDYFSNIIKAIPAGTTVMVELDNDYPVKLVFSLADGNARVNYLLAPRIESE